MNAKLRLGPIPKHDVVKLTITLSARLKADLERYAQLHTEAWGGGSKGSPLAPNLQNAGTRGGGVSREGHDGGGGGASRILGPNATSPSHVTRVSRANEARASGDW